MIGVNLNAQSIKEINEPMFSWLELQNTNAEYYPFANVNSVSYRNGIGINSIDTGEYQYDRLVESIRT